MPHYQFFIQSQSNTALRKAAIAEAFTEVHTRITGAPASYVNCTFVEVEAGSIYVGGDVTEFGRMVGIIRQGRTEEVKRQLLTELAHAWSTLAQDDQALIAKLAKEAQQDQRKLWYAMEEKSTKQIEAAGIEIIKIDDKRPFQAAVKPVWDKYGAQHVDLIKRIQDLK